jgi:alpha-amylase
MSSKSKRINFIFGIHNHQPVGNFDFVFNEACDKSYRPFLEVLDAHPSLKMVIHNTGVLLDWLIEKQPDIIDLIRKMTDRGQLEIMTGGYYEPILNAIPEVDRYGQIKKLTAKISELFNFKAEGMWLAERVWEPCLPVSLLRAGIKYTVIDDTHFKYAGLTDSQLNGYYLTEELGSPLALFPISKVLRYTIPFQDPQVTIDYLQSQATEDGESLVVFADDGEKFGVWPNTYHHVYQERWLDRFFTRLEENSQWINMMHFNQISGLIKPSGKIYLPTASYAEMLHWVLFPEKFRAYEKFENYLKSNNLYDDMDNFVRGGFWRNFLVKYPEVNDMHKKMLYVSSKLERYAKNNTSAAKEALMHLWKGQCNCAYWHGVFGGLYLSHLRDGIYDNLIRAESLADRLSGKKLPDVEVIDIDIDGLPEILVETKQYNAYFRPHRGGVMYELDFKPLAKNLLDTLTRREEGYHARLAEAVVTNADGTGQQTASIHDLVLAKEADLASKLNYDFYERKSFIDHFIGENTTLNSFSSARYKELGDFVNQPYNLTEKIAEKEQISLNLVRKGNVFFPDGQEPLQITKRFRCSNKAAHVIADYELENLSANPLVLWFGIEMNFGLQAGHAEDRFYYDRNGVVADKYLDSAAIMVDSGFIGMKDLWRGLDIQVSIDKKCEIWRFPIETISQSEGGFEKVYQSSVVFPNWKIHLKKKWRVCVELQIKNLKAGTAKKRIKISGNSDSGSLTLS